MKTKEEIRDYQKQWRQKNTDKIKQYAKEYQPKYYANKENRNRILERSRIHYQKTKEQRKEKLKLPEVQKKNREWNLLYNYGLTTENYNLMLKQQNFQCAICETSDPTTKQSKHWHVDHDHTTNKVRGLLCTRCNKGLGHFGDNVELMNKAIKYLNKHNGEINVNNIDR